MTDTYSETILFELPLPEIITTFKDTCISLIVPPLMNIVRDLERPESNLSTLFILTAIFLFLMLKQINQTFSTSEAPQQRLVAQQEIDSEIRMLFSQIKNMKNSLKKIIEQCDKQAPQGNRESSATGYEEDDIQKLIELYQKAANDYNDLAGYVLDSQQEILKEMKGIKGIKGIKRSKIQSQVNDSKSQQRVEEIKKNEEDTSEPPVEEEQKPIVEEQVSSPAPIPIPRTIPKAIPKAIKPPGIPGKKRVIPPPPIPK